MDGRREQAGARATDGHRQALAAEAGERYGTSGPGPSLHASPDQGAP
jgi:hypothetical protein